VSFGSVTVGLLVRPADAPPDDAALQDAHLAHLASLAERGALLAAGPFADQDDPAVRGIVLMARPIEEARALMDDDPKVRAGHLEVRLATWLFPEGAIRFGPADFPRSTAEAAARLRD
jgi:uncharacterized protein